MFIELDADGHVQFVHRSPVASSGGTTLASTETFRDGTWHHVAVVKSTSELRLYVDGELVDSVADTTSVHSSVDIVLGRESVSSSQSYFDGSLDDVRVYGAALTAEEIADLYGLLGRWRLDETSGTTANDSSIHGHHGTLSGGFVFGANSVSPGKVNDALDFDGSNDYIETNFASNETASITMTAWVKSDDAGTIGNNSVSQRLMTQRDASTSSRLCLGINNNRIAAGWDDGGFSVQEGTTILASGQWYHAAVTYDGSTVRLYVNGVEEGSWSESSMSTPSSDTFQIGCQYGGARHFDGALDDVRVYDRALCADEIADIHRGGKTGRLRIIRWLEVE